MFQFIHSWICICIIHNTKFHFDHKNTSHAHHHHHTTRTHFVHYHSKQIKTKQTQFVRSILRLKCVSITQQLFLISIAFGIRTANAWVFLVFSIIESAYQRSVPLFSLIRYNNRPFIRKLFCQNCILTSVLAKQLHPFADIQ